MKVLIVAATELEIISESIKDLPILITGVGMVNTAINLTKELTRSNYDLVINMGVAGSFSDEFKIGDVVEVIEDTFSEIGFQDGDRFSKFLDFKIKTSYSVISRIKWLRKAKGLTVNTIHGNEDAITEIQNRINSLDWGWSIFTPEAIETMEGASVFKVCEEFNISCIQIRAISNKIEKWDKENWDLILAIKNLNTTVEQIITEL